MSGRVRGRSGACGALECEPDALRFALLASELVIIEKCHHFERRFGGLDPLVPVRAADAVERLLIVVRGEHSENDRNARAESNLRNTARGFACNKIEMWGLASDHTSKRNHRSAMGREMLRGDRKLERARDPEQGDGVVGELRLAQTLQATLQKKLTNTLAIARHFAEAAHHNADARRLLESRVAEHHVGRALEDSGHRGNASVGNERGEKERKGAKSIPTVPRGWQPRRPGRSDAAVAPRTQRRPVDNLTHTLFATALGKSALGRRSSLAPWAMAVAANLPDADAVARVLGKEAYLTHHRGLTHSLVGLAIQVPLVAGLFAWADRGTRQPEGARAAFWALLPGVTAALASHLALDALNPYGIRPWLPFDGTWIYGDLAFIADPWQWLLFGGATALAGARSKAGSWALGLAAVGCAAVIGASGRAPSWGLGTFVAIAAYLAFLRGRGVGRSQPRRVLAIFGVLTAAYLTLLSMTGGLALQSAVRDVRSLDGGAPVGQTAAMAEPMDPLDWTVLVRAGERIYRRRLHLGTGNSEGSSFPTMLTDPLVVEASATATGEAWREFSRTPYATVETQADGSVVVTLLDARYPGIGFCTFPVTLGKK